MRPTVSEIGDRGTAVAPSMERAAENMPPAFVTVKARLAWRPEVAAVRSARPRFVRPVTNPWATFASPSPGATV